MATSENYFGDFQASLRAFSEWPVNLLSTSQFEHDLEAYQERLAAANSDLFHPMHRTARLLDYSNITDSFVLSPALGDVTQLKDAMNETTKDLRCRYVFIHSRSSRDPLSIAKEQLLYIFTHHQVMPEFSDHVATFCRREVPHVQTSFAIDDEFGHCRGYKRVDELGRSGLHLQHCFNLIGMEKDEKRDAAWPYFLRQTAAYHSFDLVGGQSFWIILKGNDLIRERIQKSLTRNKFRSRALILDSTEASISISIGTHLLIFRWCVENWSSYLDFLQSKTQRLAAHTMLSPVAEVTREEVLVRHLPSRQETAHFLKPRPSRVFSFRERLSWQSSRSQVPQALPARQSMPVAGSEQKPHITEIQNLNLEKLFSFDQLQNLHHVAERLEETRLVMGQNMKVMRDIITRFEDLHNSTAFRAHLKVIEIDFENFFRGANACLREFDNQQDRLKTMLTSLDKVMALFNGILQYKNMQTGQVFAKQANASTRTMEHLSFKMHDIAARTKQDTISMHAITILTLFFLPGTFVATFFSTGILDFSTDETSESLGEWTMRWAALKLFIAICLPLMGFVLAAWWLAWLRARQQREKIGEEDNGLSTKTEHELNAV